MKYFILPYKWGSKSARALARGLGCQLIKLAASRYKYRDDHIIINWGNGHHVPDVVKDCAMLNLPESVRAASNKLTTLEHFQESAVRAPEWTCEGDEAKEWLDKGKTVVARTKLTGHSGEGIVIISKLEEFVEAPLYTVYIKKSQEFRLHVVNNNVISRQRKAKRNDVAEEDVNWQVRNHANGFIFARNEEFEYPDGIDDLAISAIESLCLDFGAVDIVYNEHYNKCYVLEVNTACGLEGETLADYIEAFQEIRDYV
jgi:glutathione synthase/RimK-type ligase-like ATP-grasp enzyme